jgi:hypothetical protein
MLFFVALAAVLLIVVPVSMWRSALPGAYTQWLPRAVAAEHVGDGSYREVTVTRMAADGPPRLIHVTAVLSWVLGTMFVPGLFVGLWGIFVMGLGLVSIPGLMLAWRNFRLAAPLLRGDADAAARARDTARFTYGLNAIVMALCVVAFLFTQGAGERDFALLVALYALLSLTHAWLLERSADVIDAEQERREHDLADRLGTVAAIAGTGVRVAIDAPEAQVQMEDTRNEESRAAGHRS